MSLQDIVDTYILESDIEFARKLVVQICKETDEQDMIAQSNSYYHLLLLFIAVTTGKKHESVKEMCNFIGGVALNHGLILYEDFAIAEKKDNPGRYCIECIFGLIHIKFAIFQRVSTYFRNDIVRNYITANTQNDKSKLSCFDPIPFMKTERNKSYIEDKDYFHDQLLWKGYQKQELQAKMQSFIGDMECVIC